jgi:hypothetical protein
MVSDFTGWWKYFWIIAGILIIIIVIMMTKKINANNKKFLVPILWGIGIGAGLFILFYIIPALRNHFSSKKKQQETTQATAGPVSSDTTKVYELSIGSSRFDTGVMYHYYRNEISWHDVTTKVHSSTAILSYQKGHFVAGRFIPEGTSWKQSFAADGSVGKIFDRHGPNKGGNYYITVTEPLAVNVEGVLAQ